MSVPEKWRRGARKPRGGIDPSMAGDAKVGAMLTPEQIASSGSEHAHQAALFQWVNTIWKHPKRHLLFAVPNGGDRQAHVGASMRAEGVKPGVPDLCWPIQAEADGTDAGPCLVNGVELPEFCGLYLELKVPGRERTKNGGLSDAQIKWLGDLREEGYAVAVAYGWQAAAWSLALYVTTFYGATAEASHNPVDGLKLHCFGLPLDFAPSEEWLRAAGQWYGGDIASGGV